MPAIPDDAAAHSSFLILATIGNVLTAPAPPPGGWSSLIGIVTAIIGNVLISVALNTQRYAHIRLRRAAEEEEDSKEHHHHDHGRKKSYGTVQKEIAEERRKKNSIAKNEPIQDTDESVQDVQHETDALIPHVRRPSSDSCSTSSEHKQDEKEHHPPQSKNYLRSPWWWLGITLMVIGEGGNFIAYGFAPASIVSPLGVVALVSNCLIAPIMLKEKFRWRDGLGVLIAVGGAVAVVLSAKGSNPKLGPHEINALLKRWEFLTYFGVTAGAIVVLMVLSNRYGEKTIVIDIGLVGLFGGYTALSTKGVASLLSYRLFQVFTFPISYLLIATLVFTAVMQIKYLNRALQRFSSTQVIPTQFVTFTIFVVLGSAILYRDFERTTAVKVAQFLGGVALTFLGVWFITGGRQDDGDSHDEESDAEEGRITLVDDEYDTPAPMDTEESPLKSTRPTASRANTTTKPPSIPATSRPQAAPATSTTDLQTYIAAAVTSAATQKQAKTPQKRPFNRAISTPVFRTPSYTLAPPPSRFHPNSPTPSPRRPGGLGRPNSDVSFSSSLLSPSTTRPERPVRYGGVGGVDIGAGVGTAAGRRGEISSRHASLVERVLALPGPLLGTLSGGLSAVVASEVRREREEGLASPGRIGRARSKSRRRGSERRMSGRAGGADPVFEEGSVSTVRPARSGLARTESQALEDDLLEEEEELEDDDAHEPQGNGKGKA